MKYFKLVEINEIEPLNRNDYWQNSYGFKSLYKYGVPHKLIEVDFDDLPFSVIKKIKKDLPRNSEGSCSAHLQCVAIRNQLFVSSEFAKDFKYETYFEDKNVRLDLINKPASHIAFVLHAMNDKNIAYLYNPNENVALFTFNHKNEPCFVENVETYLQFEDNDAPTFKYCYIFANW